LVADSPDPALEARWQDDVAAMGYRVQLDYAAAYAKAAYRESLRQVTEVPVVPTTRESVGNGNCGGSLPSCDVMMCESRGDIRAENPSSSASGKWQLVQGTANAAASAIGRPDLIGIPASQWSEADQDAAARWLYDGGNGRGHWVC
jgi:hypothetical protein